MFSKIEDLERPQTVTLGDGRSIKTSRQGTVKLQLKQLDGYYKTGTLHNVLYVPELSFNLLSLAKATQFGKVVKFDESTCEIIDENEVIVGLCGDLELLNAQSIKDTVNTACTQSHLKI